MNQALIVQDGGPQRPGQRQESHTPGLASHPKQSCPTAPCQAAGWPRTQQPLKVPAPESIALVLNWDSEPCPVAGLVWIRADTLQEKQKVPFAF